MAALISGSLSRSHSLRPKSISNKGIGAGTGDNKKLKPKESQNKYLFIKLPFILDHVRLVCSMAVFSIHHGKGYF